MGAATVKMVWVWCTGDGADLYDELKGRWLGNTSLYEMDDSPQRIPSHTMGAENLHFLSESGPSSRGRKSNGQSVKSV